MYGSCPPASFAPMGIRLSPEASEFKLNMNGAMPPSPWNSQVSIAESMDTVDQG